MSNVGQNMDNDINKTLLLTSFRLKESKLRSEQTDEASLSSDSSRDIFLFKCMRPNSPDKSSSSGD